MRRLALLFAGGALWIVLSAAPVFADGGPHTMTLNNGSLGLAGDCAACHRAHQSTATDLLKSSQPGLCLSCHNGTGATADVVDGVQFVPDGSGNPTSSVLGALRGGGFSYAYLDTADPDRLSYDSRGGITLTFNAKPTTGSVTLDWPAFGPFAGGDLTFNGTDNAGAIQTQADALFLTSTTYSLSTDASNMTGLPRNNSNMVVGWSQNSKTGVVTVTFAPHNEFRLYPIPQPSVTSDTTGQNATVGNGISVGQASAVGVRNTAQAVTSTHLGPGTVWGNGAQGIGTAGATGVDLECTNCHNPHGNGMYRILQTTPGEDWSASPAPVAATTTLAADITAGATSLTVASATGFPKQKYTIQIGTEQLLVTAGMGTTTWTVTRGYNSTTAAAHTAGTAVKTVLMGWTATTNDVEVIDGPALTTGQVHNYTVRPGYLTTNVVMTDLPDYFRYKWDPSGATNFTNFYLLKDPMNSGWNGQTATNAAGIASIISAVTSSPKTLAANLDAYDPAGGSAPNTATLNNVTGLPTHNPPAEPQPLFIIKIDNELMTASVATTGTPPSGFSTTNIKVSRGFMGTTIANHLSGAAVTVISSDPSVDSTNAVLYDQLGRMTAFCIACHTRYNGWAQNGTSSLNAQTPLDATFTYKHGTTSVGCEQCHVNHGTNAVMTGPAAGVTFPDGTAEDSALLKVNNRGTCQLCHDPTGTIPAGNEEGTVPSSILNP